MSLTEASLIGSIEITATGEINVRRDNFILRDGKPVGSPTYHRHVLMPGADVSGQDGLVVSIAKLAWTPEVIAEYKARQEKVRGQEDTPQNEDDE